MTLAFFRPSFKIEEGMKKERYENRLRERMVKSALARKIKRRVCNFRRCILRIWDRIFTCSFGKSMYLVLPSTAEPASCSPKINVDGKPEVSEQVLVSSDHGNRESDLVSLKISLIGDYQIGKTSFLEKYVGNKNEGNGSLPEKGLNLMGKTLILGGARISYNLWEVEGNKGIGSQISLACKDSVAILIMFDLTSRVTLNGVIEWYQEARKWNQTAIPIIVGTKFDDFIQLPIDLQWEIANQARTYSKALNAPLFFSSATYNINVNKIFKFITAKLFDLPWQLQRNLKVGEPIIDF